MSSVVLDSFSDDVQKPIVSTSTGASHDAIMEIEQDHKKDTLRQEKLYRAKQKGMEEARFLQESIYKVSNPSPVLVSLLVLSVLLLVWLLYIALISPDASGIWLDEKGNTWVVSHAWMGDSLVSINNLRTEKILINDNLVKCGPLIGIWDYGNNIAFLSGGGLTRVNN